MQPSILIQNSLFVECNNVNEMARRNFQSSNSTALSSITILVHYWEVGESFKCAERNLTVMCLVSIIFVNVFLRG